MDKTILQSIAKTKTGNDDITDSSGSYADGKTANFALNTIFPKAVKEKLKPKGVSEKIKQKDFKEYLKDKCKDYHTAVYYDLAARGKLNKLEENTIPDKQIMTQFKHMVTQHLTSFIECSDFKDCLSKVSTETNKEAIEKKQKELEEKKDELLKKINGSETENARSIIQQLLLLTMKMIAVKPKALVAIMKMISLVPSWLDRHRF